MHRWFTIENTVTVRIMCQHTVVSIEKQFSSLFDNIILFGFTIERQHMTIICIHNIRFIVAIKEIWW